MRSIDLSVDKESIRIVLLNAINKQIGAEHLTTPLNSKKKVHTGKVQPFIRLWSHKHHFDPPNGAEYTNVHKQTHRRQSNQCSTQPDANAITEIGTHLNSTRCWCYQWDRYTCHCSTKWDPDVVTETRTHLNQILMLSLRHVHISTQSDPAITTFSFLPMAPTVPCPLFPITAVTNRPSWASRNDPCLVHYFHYFSTSHSCLT